jgi:sodium-dependent dicarboxylate transporter 2/3/5
MQQIKPLRILFALVLAALFFFMDLPISGQAYAVLLVTVFIGTLWFSEAMPLHVAALLGTFLLVVFASVSPKDAFTPYFSPTIVLFFGGFILARAMQKHGLDQQIAISFISKFGRDPKNFLLGIMIITAFLSFWISNTASTAIMLPIVLFTLSKSNLRPLESNYGKAVVLGVAFAATIGGIGTIVGTPPNGITVANLAEQGIIVPFAEWLYYSMPFVILFLPVAWFILTAVYKPEVKTIALAQKRGKWTRNHEKVLAIGGLTMALWMTSIYHGIPDSVVALVPVILLYLFELLEKEDMSKIDWSVLLLFGGGLSLGAAIDSSGLSTYLGGLLGGIVAGQTVFMLFLSVIVFAVILTLSASNTATAALIVPIVIPLAAMTGTGIKELAILAGIGTSLDFLVPVGTPPSAIAYSSGYIRVWDMLKVGIFITTAGILLLAFLAWLYW